MKEEFVNSFLSPAKLVWDKELGHSLDLDHAKLVDQQFTTDEVIVAPGVS